MSGVAAILAAHPELGATTVRRMLTRMRARGADETTLLEANDGTTATLGIAGHQWERALRHGALASASDGTRLVVADATLYHTADLRHALGTPELGNDAGAASLILAAYARWGEESCARLEGDFAFIIWDGARRRLVAARDFAGHRSLYYAVVDDTLRLASTVGGLLADPLVPSDLDLASVASVAAGLWTHSAQTAYRAIREVPAGHLLTWEPGTEPGVRPFWSAPDTILVRRQPLDSAAEELRQLLTDAVRERLAPQGVTGLSLSGGWDSTAVFGAGQHALADGAGARSIQPISISYPANDPGNEDDLIRAVAQRWATEPTWLTVDSLPIFANAELAAANRDEPFAHAYEEWNRALSRGARASGARVMLDGVGGDQLFQVSDIYLSDLFQRGRWIELARQWRGRGGRGIRNFWRWAVRPALPSAVTRLVASVRGMPAPGHHFDRRPPMWFEHRFLDAHGVLDRERAAAPRLPQHDRVLGETHAYLRYPFFARVLGHLGSFAVEEGVELRSPLLDDRVVRFGARRPWSERADRRETKVVLRRAMRGLLPDHVLAPRPHRTGVTTAYFFRQLRGPGRPFIERLLQDPLLASLGMIEPTRLRRAWDHVLRHDDDSMAAGLFFTIQTEAWLRSRAHLPPVAATLAAGRP